MKKILLSLFLLPFLLGACNNKKGNTSSVTPSEHAIRIDISEVTLMEDDTYQLETTILKPGTIVFYSSVDENVATVSDDGLITAVHAGSTFITVIGGKYTINIYVEVKPYDSHDSLQIVLDKDSFTLAVNDTFNLPISVKLGNEIINDALISYTIGNPQVVSISNNVVTALSAGTTKCVATASYLEEEVSKGFNITVY